MTQEIPHYIHPFVMGVSGLGWLLLALFPRQSWANFWMAGVVLPLILCFLYSVTFAIYWFVEPEGSVIGFVTLSGLRLLFDNPGLLLSAFIDLTAIPLILGAWVTRKCAQVRMPYLLILICLLLIAAVPATGFVFFAIVVTIRGNWKEIAQLERQNATPGAAVSAL